MNEIYQFLSGAFAMGCLVAAAFFFRFRRRTGTVIFSVFGWAFLIFAAERVTLLLGHAQQAERLPLIYLERLFGFVLILFGIIRHNRNHGRER